MIIIFNFYIKKFKWFKIFALVYRQKNKCSHINTDFKYVSYVHPKKLFFYP